MSLFACCLWGPKAQADVPDVENNQEQHCQSGQRQEHCAKTKESAPGSQVRVAGNADLTDVLSKTLRELCELSQAARCVPFQLVNRIHCCLEASDTKLYGFDDSGEQPRLVLLARCSSSTTLECISNEDALLGWSMELSPPVDVSSAGSSMGTWSTVEHSVYLLQRAVAARKVVVDSWRDGAPSVVGGVGGVYYIDSQERSTPDTLSAALPLTFGDHLAGVLQLTARPRDTLSRAVLCSPTALQQLALSASLALAAVTAGVGPGPGVGLLGDLAASLRRLADSSSLQALIWELRQALAQHVKRQFLLDVSVQAAVMPRPDSRVAFMLHTDAPPPPPLLHSAAAHADVAMPADKWGTAATSPTAAATAAAVAASATVPGAVDGLMGSLVGSIKPRPVPRSSNFERQLRTMPAEQAVSERSASQATMHCPAAALAGGQASPAGPCSSKTWSAAAPPAARRSMRIIQLPLVGTTTAPQVPEPTRSLDAVGAAAAAAAVNTANASASSNTQLVQVPVPVLVPALRAKPFQLSHTLLQTMVASGPEPGAGCDVYVGPLVPACARWVQDVRRPSRDVYLAMAAGANPAHSAAGGAMLSASKGARAAGINGASSGTGGSSTGGHAAQSLALLGLDAGGGAVLGLYLGFATQLPRPLLEALSGSCASLLRQIAAQLRAKLQGELASELGTVLAGVPGSYASFAPCPSVPPPPAVVTAVDYGLATASSGGGGGGGGSHTAEGVVPPSRLARTTTVASCNSQLFATEAPDAAMATSGSGFLMCVDPLGSAAVGAMLMATGQLEQRRHTNGGLELVDGLTGETLHGELQACSARARPTCRPRVPQLPIARQPNGGSGAGGGNGGGGGGGVTRPHSRQTASCVDAAQHGSHVIAAAAAGAGAGAVTSPVGHLPHGQLLRMGSSLGAATPRDALVMSQDVLVDMGALTSVLTVHEVDGGSSMRAQMGLLVDAIIGTLRSNALTFASEDARKTAAHTSSLIMSSSRGAAGDCNAGLEIGDDLDDLQLYEILGDGSSGVVLRGLLGTNPVAVKLMEVPDVDDIKLDEAAGAAARGSRTPAGGGGGGGAANAHAHAHANVAAGGGPEEALLLEARRTMLRNAMELAVLRSVSHINIVQCHAVYDNVRLEKMLNGGCVLRRQRNCEEQLEAAMPGAPTSPICIAIVTELCTNGSLAGALSDRSFPKMLLPQHPQGGGGGAGGGAGSAEAQASARSQLSVRVDMQGIYLTLLDIALALRYLHSRRLVHRDLKPANVLLKESPGDPRGWTCKLADFGFALVLDQQGSTGSAEQPETGAAGAGASATHSGLRTFGGFSGTGSSGGRVGGMPRASSHAEIAAMVTQHGAGAVAGGAVAGPPAALWYTVQDQACGTVTHMAPEAMKRGSRIDASVDVFAFGVIMWELLCGRGHRPYARLKPDDIPRAVMAGLRPCFSEDVPAAYRRLAQACWATDPSSRPRAADLVAAIKAQMSALSSQPNASARRGRVGDGRGTPDAGAAAAAAK